MPKAISHDNMVQERSRDAASKRRDWRKSISDHLACALLVYTGLHIAITMTAIKVGKGAILPYFALVILVVAIIPVARLIERRWEEFGEEAAGDPAMAGTFRRDAALIWLGALGLPLLVTGICKATS